YVAGNRRRVERRQPIVSGSDAAQDAAAFEIGIGLCRKIGRLSQDLRAAVDFLALLGLSPYPSLRRIACRELRIESLYAFRMSRKVAADGVQILLALAIILLRFGLSLALFEFWSGQAGIHRRTVLQHVCRQKFRHPGYVLRRQALRKL